MTLIIAPDEGWAVESVTVMCGETPVDVAADYSFIMPAGDVTVTVTTKEYDGTPYTITVAETTNGTVKTSVTSAAAKETITVTVTPDSGYVLETLTFNGTAITANDNGAYTFPMPWAAVTVSATFAAHDPHSYENGFCTCGGCEPAVRVTAENYEELGFTEENYEGYLKYYAIANAGQLYWFADRVNGIDPSAKAVLTDNIVVNTGVLEEDGNLAEDTSSFKDWTPIGDATYKYTGTFDGRGHTISGLYFSNESTDYVGLFGWVYNGTVKNVGVVDSYFCGQDDVGGVVGHLYANFGSASVENCYNTGIVKGTGNDVGGVVGYLYANDEGSRATVTNCYNTGNVSGNPPNGYSYSNYIGGVVGLNMAYSGTATVVNCYNTGNVSSSGGSWYVGGVAGSNEVSDNGTATIENCYYLTNCATDGEVYQNGIGASSNGSTTADVEGDKVTAVKDEVAFTSGAVAYLLNGDDAGTDAGVWKQTLGTDDFPNFTGKTVYPLANGGYTNHEHNWSYEGSGNQIQATCTAEGCTLTGNVTITLVAPVGTYDGTTAYKVDVIVDSTAFTVSEDEIKYTANNGGELTNGLPVNAGSYTAKLTLGEGTDAKTATVTYTIAKADSSVTTAPTAISNLTYNGSAQALVTAGAAEGGEMQYSLDNEIWGTAIPNGTNAGDYTVYYKAAGDGNHNDTEAQFVTVTIGKAASGVTAPEAISGLTYNGKAQTLITAGFTDDGTMQYKLGEYGKWSNALPTATDADTYTVYYKVVGDINHNDNVSESYFVTVTIGDCIHTGERRAEFTWYEESDGTYYVNAFLYCADCDSYIDYNSGYAENTSSIEAVDCKTPGSATYSITLNIDGKDYTDTQTYEVKSDNHIGEFVNGFCSACGGYEKPSTQQGEYEWETVYAIDNAGKLFWFADYINNVSNDANALVTKDITIPEDKEWTPILNFYGTFDGGFKTISGFNCVSDTEYTGMFGGGGYSYGTIKNVHITDSYFEGTSYVGGLAGYHAGTISNCYVDNTVTVVGNDYVGALVGNLAGNMYNCYAYASTAIGSYNSNYASVVDVYYLSETETEDGGKTAEQFASGEVAYLLQAGIVGDDIFDEETGEYIGAADPEHVWGQSIGTEIYPVFKGTKVYGNIIGGCCEENYVLDYSNTQADPISSHIYDKDGKCACGDLNYFYIGNLSSQIRFGTNDDGSYNFTFDIRTRAKITDADFTRFIGATNEEAVKNITKAGFVYSINPEGFVIDNAKAVAMGGKVDGYTDAPVKSIWDEDGYYMFSCTVTNIPYTETAQTLVSFAYICVEIDGVEYWYFMEAQAEADFNSLYTTYIPMACEAYGWEKLGYVNNNDGTHTPVCEICGTVDETTKETHKYENGTCVCGAASYTYDETTKTYTVYTAEGLYAWNTAAQADLSTNLTLMADITLPNTDLTTGEEITVADGVPSGSNWTPISTVWDKAYIGTFEGNNHTITGLRINGGETNHISLIGCMGDGTGDGEVKNLTLANAVLYGTGSSVSGFAGYNYGGTISGCTFGSSTTDGSSVSGAGTSTKAGGIVGTNDSGLVSGCTNYGSVSTSSTWAGGIAAYNIIGTVSNCTNNGTVSASGSSEAKAGGIVGQNMYSSTVSGCTNNGDVSATGVRIRAGGIVGTNQESTVSGCKNYGEASGDGSTNAYVGGIVGANLDGTVDDTNDNVGTPITNVGNE